MGLLEFSKLPVNTLVGADWQTFKAVTSGQHIAPEKRTKYLLTKAVCRLLSVCVPLQERKYRKLLAESKPAHDPLFILGHWRSGTTTSLPRTSISATPPPIRPSFPTM